MVVLRVASCVTKMVGGARSGCCASPKGEFCHLERLILGRVIEVYLA